MKLKLLLAAAAVGLSAVAGNAAYAAYGMAGCGLGSIIISGDGFMQVFAATTNGTFASQTFGITTGTSNCVKAGVVIASKEQEAFFEVNYANVQRDMASGGGEHLAALTDLFGCEPTMGPAVASFAQSHYEQVFPTESTNAVQALYALKLQMSMQEQFAAGCTKL